MGRVSDYYEHDLEILYGAERVQRPPRHNPNGLKTRVTPQLPKPKPKDSKGE